MLSIFSDLVEHIIEVYMDDITVYGESFEEWLINLETVLHKCMEKNLVLNGEKCHFMVSQGIVLGHIISEKGIEVDKEKMNLISQMPPPPPPPPPPFPHTHKCQDCKEFLGACRVLQEVHHGLLKNSQASLQIDGKKCQIYLGCRLLKVL